LENFGKGLPKSFADIIERLKITKPIAIEAQRIACLPPSELESFCVRARAEAAGQLPTFAELLRFARSWWYQDSRQERHREIARRARQVREQLAAGFALNVSVKQIPHTQRTSGPATEFSAHCWGTRIKLRAPLANSS
jgi:hypothetical protein